MLRRHYFKITSKKRLMHDMKIVLFFGKKEEQRHSEVKCLKMLKHNLSENLILRDLNKQYIFSQMFFNNLGILCGCPNWYTSI